MRRKYFATSISLKKRISRKFKYEIASFFSEKIKYEIAIFFFSTDHMSPVCHQPLSPVCHQHLSPVRHRPLSPVCHQPVDTLRRISWFTSTPHSMVGTELMSSFPTGRSKAMRHGMLPILVSICLTTFFMMARTRFWLVRLFV